MKRSLVFDLSKRSVAKCVQTPEFHPDGFENVYVEPTALLREEREQYAAYLDSFVPEEAAQ